MSCGAAPGSRHTYPHSTPCRASRTGGRAGSAGESRGGGRTRSKSRSALTHSPAPCHVPHDIPSCGDLLQRHKLQ